MDVEGGGERGRNVKKNGLVMKCNKNVNIPYCGEYLSEYWIVWRCWYSDRKEEYRENLAI